MSTRSPPIPITRIAHLRNDTYSIIEDWEDTKYVYFWRTNDNNVYKCFSNWYRSEFIDDNDRVRYSSTEQYLMAKKAHLFNKEGDNNEILNAIMLTNSPYKIKDLGKKVKNFDEKIWEKNREQIMYRGIYLKFTQNKHLLEILLSTDRSIIAEASPYDKIWGIGVEEKKGLTRKDWKGLNLLGNALMKFRDNITQ